MPKFFLLFFLFASLKVVSQPCQYNLFFDRQGQIDSFSLLYPQCDEISGRLLIYGEDITHLDSLYSIHTINELRIENTSITDLNGLEGLTSYVYNLYMTNNALLEDISALRNLDTIGYLGISHSTLLTSLDGIDSLKMVTKQIHLENLPIPDLRDFSNLDSVSTGLGLGIKDLDSIKSLDGIPFNKNMGHIHIEYNESLEEITAMLPISKSGSIRFWSNDMLQSLTGLDSLKEARGQTIFANNPMITNVLPLRNLQIVGDLWFTNNESLTSLDGLQKISQVNVLYIEGNRLTNLTGLNNIKTVKDNAFIRHNGLESLSGLDQLETVAGTFEIREDSLTSLEGLESLISVKYTLVLESNASLTSLSGAPSLEHVGYLKINDNPSLQTLSGLTSLIEIETTAEITNNSVLQNLSGLNNLTMVGEDLLIKDLPALFSLEGLDNLQFIGRHLHIDDNNTLTNISALQDLNDIGGDLKIYSNDNLKNLTGLQNVTSLGGDLYLGRNDLLENIWGLISLRSISGSLTITHNESLTSIHGIGLIDPDGITHITLANNAQLTECNALNICEHLGHANKDEVFANAAGCNSRDEIISSCNVSTSNTNKVDVLIYPNPVFDNLQISGIDLFNSGISITNSTGIEVKGWTFTENSIDMIGLTGGIYFITIAGPDRLHTFKIVRL